MECKSIQSSSSSSTMQKYDVFVSFRGEDIRNSFADHLFAAFQRKGIVAFRDDRNLKQGEHISTELTQAIKGSQVLIVVFSKNYATSSWCLQELEKIVDCMNMEVPTGQSVLPVFYDVDPSEVRKQSGDYEKAFTEHEKRFKQDLGMVKRWRNALTKVADLSGWDVQNKPQYGETEQIVKMVMSILGNKFSCLPNDLVGMHSHVEELEKFLVLDSLDVVRVIGIYGMGGIGKTTLAKVLYHRISHQYGASCFIDDVSKVYQDHGSLGAQKQLLCQILNEENQEVWNLSKATYLTRTIISKVKAFIVLDNVDDIEQLETLAMNRELLCAGSKLILVSRNKHILEQFGVDKIYQVQCLNKDNALQLFCRKAFKCDHIMHEYEELTYRVLRYAQGHPLAIKVLGSFLFGRDTSEWKSALDRLRDDPKKEIVDVFRISFDGLEQTEKEIFLDIACFFNRNDEKYVKRVLNCCGFHPDIGLRVLIDKSLITIQGWHIHMHGMLEELGRKIVREKAPNDPNKWSRLWHHKDFGNLMFDKMAMKDLEAIKLQNNYARNPSQKETLRAKVLSKMSHLRLLILEDVNFFGSLDCLSNELQYLEWHKYPFTYLPSSFEPNKLVELILPCSSIKRLWEDTKTLHSLRVMDLHDSKNLTRMPDFRGLPDLEQLNVEGCTKLVKIHPSIGLLRKLVVLNLKNCTSLKSLPLSIFGLSSLEVLNLSGCSKLFNSQLLEQARNVEHLKKHDVSETAMKCQSPSSVLKKFSFPFFSSTKKKEIVGLLLPSFPCLQDLNLRFCNLLRIPDAIGCLHDLKRLKLGGNNFVTLPSSIKELRRLISLDLQHCKQLKYLPELPSGTDFPTRGEFAHEEYIPIGFYIFDCPKLVEMESWSSIALSRMKQVIQVGLESRSSIALGIEIVVPGTQVPRWFNNQVVGNSIRLDPFPLHDSNWIGLAFCVAFGKLDHSIKVGGFRMTIGPTFGRRGCRTRFLSEFAEDTEIDLVKDELDHLYLRYLPREVLIEIQDDYDGTEGEVLMCIEGIEDPDFFDSLSFRLVKNWGFRWVFKQDLELEETMTNNELWIEPFASKRKPLLNL